MLNTSIEKPARVLVITSVFAQKVLSGATKSVNAWRLAHTSTVIQATISIKTFVNAFARNTNHSIASSIGTKIPKPVHVSVKSRNV